MPDFAVALLVDARGWILLQERDEHAPIDPDRWGLVGGHVEAGESHDAAVRRELAEEAGVAVAATVDAVLEPWRQLRVRHPQRTSDDLMSVYAAATRLRDQDIVVGEGRQIVFVDPDRAPILPLSVAAAHAVPAFLGSATYRRLAAQAATSANQVSSEVGR